MPSKNTEPGFHDTTAPQQCLSRDDCMEHPTHTITDLGLSHYHESYRGGFGMQTRFVTDSPATRPWSRREGRLRWTGLDAYRCAKLLMDQHGQDTDLPIAMRPDKMEAAGGDTGWRA